MLFRVLKLCESNSFLSKKLLFMRFKIIWFFCCIWLWLFREILRIICSSSYRFGMIFLWVIILIDLNWFLLLFHLFHPHRFGDLVKYKLMLLIIEPCYVLTRKLCQWNIFMSHFFSNFLILFHNILHILIALI